MSCVDKEFELFTACSQVAEVYGLEMPLYPVDELAAQIRHAKLAADREIYNLHIALADRDAEIAKLKSQLK